MRIRACGTVLFAAFLLSLSTALPTQAQEPTPTCAPGTPPSTPPPLQPIAPPYARPKGLRVTLTNVNPATREVSFNVTLNTTAGFASGNRSYPFGQITDTWQTFSGSVRSQTWTQRYCEPVVVPMDTAAGAGLLGPNVVDPAWPSIQDGVLGIAFDALWAQYYSTWAGTAPPGTGWTGYGGMAWPARIVSPVIQAVEFGDGGYATGTPILPLVNPGPPQYGTFRGSFTHTYPPTPDVFTIRAAAASLFLGPDTPSNPYLALTAGRPGIVVPNQSAIQLFRFGWTGTPGDYTWAPATQTVTVTSAAGRVLAITNTALVNFGAREIPTSSAAALFALALLLAALGIILIRR